MATKNKPGRYDCYANAEPDEPMFVLLARDDLAPYVIRIWAALRSARANSGSKSEITEAIEAALEIVYEKTCMSIDKFNEARECANDMEAWRKAHPLK